MTHPLAVIRHSHSMLRPLLDHVDDAGIRDQLERVCHMLADCAEPSVADHNIDHRLTQREIEILAIAAEGKSNIEIAQRLSLSPETVKGYLRNSMYKLNSRNRIEAVNSARSAGLPI